MTTESTTVAIDIEARKKALAEAQATLDAALVASEKGTAELMSSKDKRDAAFFSKLGKLAEPVEAAEAAVKRATDALKADETRSYWAQAEETRKPVVSALRSMLIDNAPVAHVTAVHGVVTIDDDGNALVTLKPVISDIDMADIESAIAATIDAGAFLKQDIKSIDVNVTNIGKADAMVNLMPTNAVNSSARVKVSSGGVSGGTRAGAITYVYGGETLGARAFLEKLESEKHAIATERATAFETALRGTGNGLSNLAKAVAPKVGATVQVAETPTK